MPLFTLAELLKQDVKVEYLIYPYFTRGGTMLLAAPNKSMKTFLGLHLATAIAAGKRFIDTPTQQERVLYVDFEVGIAEAKKRMHPMATHYGVSTDLHIRTADEQPLSFDWGTSGHANMLRLLDSVRPGVVFIDALRFATHHNENDSTEMSRVMGEIRRLKLMYHFSVVLIHHMGKEPDERSTTVRTSRGSSVIEDAPDSIGHIKAWTGDSKTPSKLAITWKLRNHAPVDPSRFTFDPKLGLFTLTPKKEAKEPKHATEVDSELSEGLLPAEVDTPVKNW